MNEFPVGVSLGESARGGAGEGCDPVYGEPQRAITGVKDVLLVASGKGGVGKSTVTVNLACALSEQGLKVGIVDADLYGPSIARMLGTGGGLEWNREGQSLPAVAHGIPAVSVANVLPPEAALVWKGPLVAQAVVQMFHQVAWPELDLLLVDLPPGTGDVQLTLLEQIPVTGAILVSTPQRLAMADAERGIALFHDLDIPVFGLIENMHSYICPCCGEEQPLFPRQGVEALARRRHVAYLGGIPLEPGAQRLADEGVPLLKGEPDAVASRAFRTLAGTVRDAVEREARSRLRDADEETRKAHQAFWERLMD
ncbi:MAG TPA: iron-sulfur cluster carrier protein ApbC [Sedimenticola thiotaurini]|uniref:Iron-sulfur cluster carrier protein n=1 Tax=Sedimenticola thiotaurini TaxID=1543721 RepID=A0A831RI65_9GAMM|nr:iron-sulfur cluster carrier protein ApbC [Sedimenticola thiotaurini]